jgi:signal transduction histidine kinase
MRPTDRAWRIRSVTFVARSQRSPVLLGVAGACCLTGIAVVAVMARPGPDQPWPVGIWTSPDALSWVLAIVSEAVTALSGVWLRWRLPRNPTGVWLVVAAVALLVWTVGTYRPDTAGAVLEAVAPAVAKAAIVVAVVRWPTGRSDPRWAAPFALSVALYLVVSAAAPFVGDGGPRRYSLADAVPTVVPLAVGTIVTMAVAALVAGVAPMVFLATVVQRVAQLPSQMRTSARPVVLGAAIMAGVEVWVFITDGVLRPIGAARIDPITVDVVRSAADICRFGLVAGLLVISETLRRATAPGVAAGVVELGDLPDLGRDPIAEQISGPAPERLESTAFSVAEPVAGPGVRGRQLAQLRRTRAEAVALATAQVRMLQLRLIEAHDAARRRLERDLHDGVQQRLLALALQASLLARREARDGISPAGRLPLLGGITDTLAFVREIVEKGEPVVVASGLANGLTALATAAPVRTRLVLTGDLEPDHPAIAALWFTASEAVTNVLKHARATQITIRLTVDDHAVELSVIDDGIGGVTTVPRAIARRLAHLPAQVAVDSPPGSGTCISATVPRLPAPVP